MNRWVVGSGNGGQGSWRFVLRGREAGGARFFSLSLMREASASGQIKRVDEESNSSYYI